MPTCIVPTMQDAFQWGFAVQVAIFLFASAMQLVGEVVDTIRGL
jgi:hypothetical protein